MRFDSNLEKVLKEKYPEGTRVECIEMPDDPYPVPSGTKGTVEDTNGFGQIQVRWDNGSGLSLIYGVDKFEIVSLPTSFIMKQIKELDVQYIVLNGYYSNKDDGNDLLQHTNETYALYIKGLNETYDGDLTDNEDVFNGVCFNDDGSPLAEWLINGKEEYFTIS